MAEQLPGSYYVSPYKFNGKELDQETGLYYYGARYYDPKGSVWLSVDPMGEQYPSVNPYAYCLNNPINLVDPDGRSVDNEYNYDLKTHEYTYVSNKGGDKTDYVNIMSGNEKQWTEEINVIRKTTNVQTDSEIGRSVTTRNIGSIHTTNYKPRGGGGGDPTAEFFVGYAGGELLSGVLGFAWKGLTNILTEGAVEASAGATSKITLNAVSETIHMGKQGKHIIGHNNYDIVKSVLTEDAQGLLDAFHSGNINSSQVVSEFKTRVDFGKVIGNFIEEGVSTPTTNGIIHNAKTGAHIVPSRP